MKRREAGTWRSIKYQEDEEVKEEIWISIQGDSGAGIFKLIALLGNSSGPVNSIENAACLVIFEADETPENIRKACGRVINEIVEWKNC
jgi:hypothetical protein